MLNTKISQLELEIAEDYLKDDAGEVLSPEFKHQLFDFYHEFISEDDYVNVISSGSTGQPKQLQLSKRYMLESASMTCNSLNIPSGASSLLCMPLKFIGAKMVVVRALLYKLKIVAVTPSSHPLKGLKKAPYFAAMTPAQVYSSLENSHERSILMGIRELIIGGGAVSESLQKELMASDNHIYSTYGMTETISHIALKRLNPKDGNPTSYVPFDGVSLSKAKDDTLIINAPYIGVYDLKTNDIVEFFKDGSFAILGRADNIINSGGIKIQIEKLESLIAEIYGGEFNITSVNSEKYGQSVCMLIKKDSPVYKDLSDEAILETLKANVPKYWAPKMIYRVDCLPKTESGKSARAKLKELAASLYCEH